MNKTAIIRAVHPCTQIFVKILKQRAYMITNNAIIEERIPKAAANCSGFVEKERIPSWRLVGKALKPSVRETTINPRSRTAIMRVIERVA